ncbi:AAA family ATPase [Mycobacteroides saopaulense]|uniref:ATPase AAA-type core domain-containing protein n=1 Tax=Mycobacteroides saopaulense TaxID=1578165 RepID=A0ABX3BVH5_9MYCO|nr:ATP-binding protein [Mycobacteroides saopaulense]OHT88083.1 hypothetical protein BKG68_08990 [Mycobacteroides saopaulense]OHU06424.1 hypothetical protein BKG73_23135 [Mycobacteroides saopaulense]
MDGKIAPKAHTMLLGFQAENVRSFRDRIDFSMEATTMALPGVPRGIPWRQEGRNLMRVLPVAGVFGANASGKSSLLRVMDDMRRFVRESFTSRRTSERPLRYLRQPFLLDSGSKDRPSVYEVDLILDGIRHEYGFEVDDHRVIREWARRYPRGKAATIFERTPHDLRMESRSAKGRAVRELVRDDALILSIAHAAEYAELLPLYQWFSQNFRLCDAATRDSRSKYTAQLMEREDRRQQVLQLLQIADLGIVDAHRREPPEHEVEFYRKVLRAIKTVDGAEVTDDHDAVPEAFAGVELSHRGVNGVGVPFDSDDESLGTLVWLGLVGPLVDALINGTVILVDELEASLHPLLVEQFVTIFQSRESNPNNAQLIFNSHEARLLGNSEFDRIIGRDQAWFTEKIHDGSTNLYSLTDLNPRKSEAIARRYLQGRYGATPIISPDEFMTLTSVLAADAMEDA